MTKWSVVRSGLSGCPISLVHLNLQVNTASQDRNRTDEPAWHIDRSTSSAQMGACLAASHVCDQQCFEIGFAVSQETLVLWKEAVELCMEIPAKSANLTMSPAPSGSRPWSSVMISVKVNTLSFLLAEHQSEQAEPNNLNGRHCLGNVQTRSKDTHKAH